MRLPRNVFIDTAFFISLLNRDDVEYQRAMAMQTQLTTQRVHKVTSDYVLLELCDGLSRLRYRALAVVLEQ
jgi:predicted nucleic acid-binding protein